MSSIVLIDTSIYMNVLNVPDRNQNREEVLAEFARRIDDKDHFLLPMATIWETGNHISRLSTGGLRRTYAEIFVTEVVNALNGLTPYRPTYFPEKDIFTQWLIEFPGYASRNKSPEKRNEGVSLADLSIVKEWERSCELHAMSRVMIWSLDSDLQAYDRII